jgi:hypothetical protein
MPVLRYRYPTLPACPHGGRLLGRLVSVATVPGSRVLAGLTDPLIRSRLLATDQTGSPAAPAAPHLDRPHRLRIASPPLWRPALLPDPQGRASDAGAILTGSEREG